MEFVTFKKPTTTSGYLVIESDDGKVEDYTYWLKLTNKIAQEYSDFYPPKCVVVCPNVNTGRFGDEGFLDYDKVKELQWYGWEIMSHGRFHIGLGKHPFTQNVNAGGTRIYLTDAGYIGHMGGTTNYIWKIVEGEKTENVVVSVATTNYIDIQQPLINSYTTNATIQLTTDSIYSLLNECKNDLTEHGIKVSSHVYTYHAGSFHHVNEEAINIVRELFISARGSTTAINNPLTADLHNLKALLINDSLTENTIDTNLQIAKENNHVMICYGHGESGGIAYQRLEYLIRKALTMGIKIITRNEAVKILSNANG